MNAFTEYLTILGLTVAAAAIPAWMAVQIIAGN